jgi:hypothetical protein
LVWPSYSVALLDAEGASFLGVSVIFNAANAEAPPPPSYTFTLKVSSIAGGDVAAVVRCT